MVIYVDDFLMSGPQAGLNACWKAIRCATDKHPGIDMEDPKTVSRYLGCDHIFGTAKCPISGKPVRTLTWDMSEFMQSSVDAYEKLAGWKCTRQVETPFLPAEDEPPSKDFVSAVANQLQQRGSMSDKITPHSVDASLQCAQDASTL